MTDIGYTPDTEKKLDYKRKIERLPQMEKNCWCLFKLEGWTQEEIGKHYGICQQRVSQHINEALKKILSD